MLYESSSDESDEPDDGEGEVKGRSSSGLVDLEDIGGMIDKMKSAKRQRSDEEEAMRKGKAEPREMVTPMLRKALTKQGVLVVVIQARCFSGGDPSKVC